MGLGLYMVPIVGSFSGIEGVSTIVCMKVGATSKTIPLVLPPLIGSL